MSTWPGRLVADRSLRVLDAGRVLIGGSPLTVLRFAEPIDLDGQLSPQTTAKIVDLGMAHPRPQSGPFRAGDITVVIPVHDDPAALGHTLASLVRAAWTPAAIVVVDDGSEDAAAIESTATSSSIGGTARLVRRSTNGGAAAARNRGLVEVATPLVMFLDAGCEVAPDQLDRLLSHFADPTLVLVAPRIVAGPDRSTGSSWIRRRIGRYESICSPLDLGPEEARVAPRSRVSYVPSACVVVHVDALREAGGFDERLRVGEDVDLVWRFGESTPVRRVRYEPSIHVGHDHRTRPLAWARRRFDYGTSAAPLARRHPGGPAPVSLSPWSVAAWAAVAMGRSAIGVGIGAGSTALLARRLGGLPEPWSEAVRLAGRGNVAAGGLLANALRRTWWPMAFGAGLVSRRARRTLVAAFVVPPLVEWARSRPPLDPLTWLALHTVDDLAYGTGVWIGCIRERTSAPLLPEFT